MNYYYYYYKVYLQEFNFWASWDYKYHIQGKKLINKSVLFPQKQASRICKSSICPITNPNPVYSHSVTWQYYLSQGFSNCGSGTPLVVTNYFSEIYKFDLLWDLIQIYFLRENMKKIKQEAGTCYQLHF
jgi:hypothetical protein